MDLSKISKNDWIVVVGFVLMIIGSDLLSLQQSSLDTLAHLLDFVVLLCFFVGIIKK